MPLNHQSPITNHKSIILKSSLASEDIHARWESAFRTEDNRRFTDLLFRRILAKIDLPPGSLVLDAGCGPAYHSLRLARSGCQVVALDFSIPVLQHADFNIRETDLSGKIALNRGSLLHLPYGKDSFDAVLCFGVLMHIADISAAIGEICRVLKPGGFAVISEINRHALEAMILTFLRKIFKSSLKIDRTPAGLEHWSVVEGRPLLVRWTKIPWLIREFSLHNCSLHSRIAGQFTEAYTFLPGTLLKKIAHWKNRAYFHFICLPHLALGNICIFRKS